MSMVDEYIVRANAAIRTGSSLAIDSVGQEIVAAFDGEIPSLSHFRGAPAAGEGSHCYNAACLSGSCAFFQEGKDAEIYGEYGLATLTGSIRQLQNALAEDYIEVQYDLLFRKIDSIYANRYDSYTDGLCGYAYNDDAPDASQAKLRIEKLRLIRDEELREFNLVQLRAASVYISQSQNQDAQAEASCITAIQIGDVCESVDEIPKDVLSNDDKLKLKGMLAELEQAKSKDLGKKKEKIHDALKFAMDKGVDVVLAVIPYIGEVIRRVC